MRRITGGFLLIGIFAGIAWYAVPDQRTALAAPAVSGESPAIATDFKLLGVSSCAAMACHHQNGAPDGKGSEYSTWIAHDPHARASQVLFDDRSKQICKNLKEVDPPEKNARCLTCHVTFNEKDDIAKVALSDGIGCESCHGPAEKWVSEHYSTGWKDLAASKKAEKGFRPTKDLAARARLCVSCHVGAGTSDVNHDLIAAGHPRMTFEYSAYLANYPKHWKEVEPNDKPDFEARAWAIGQAVTAQAGLELLAFRANPKNNRPWPELAEYDCYSCHHDLADQAWRRSGKHVTGKPGALPWNAWYRSLLDVVAEESPNAPSLKELEKLLGKPFPDRVKVAEEATAAAKRVGALLPAGQGKDFDKAKANAKVQAMLARLEAKAKQELSSSSWDEAAQLYLGLTALHHAHSDLENRKRDPAQLKGLLDKLAFPRSFDSPRGFDPAHFPPLPDRRGR